MRCKKIFLAVLTQAWFGMAVAAPQQTTVGDIKNSLVCLCDCNMVVEACQGSMACESADKLTIEAEGYIGQGMNKDAVLATFIKKYGEHILAAPTKKGFNLTAWVLPFAVIILAGFAISTVLWRWVRQAPTRSAKPLSKASAENGVVSQYEAKLDAALRHLD